MRREFPDWLSAFCSYASYGETPERFLYWCGVSAIAGALERKVWIDQGRFLLYPNFYIIFVAKAGRIQKSTTVNEGMRLLKKVPSVKFAPKNTTWEGLIQRMDQLHSSDNRTLDEDAENTKTAAIMIVSPEFSVFFDPDNTGLVSALTDLWDCPDDWDKFTIYRQGETLEKPCLNLIGATTPSWVRQSFDRWTKEGGFPSRTLFIHADRKAKYVAWPKRNMPANIEAIRAQLIKDLCRINRLKGCFEITEEAYVWGEEWYNEHCRKLESEHGDVTGFRDRKQAHVLKLAMVIAVSKRDRLLVTLTDLKEAVARIDAIEGDFDDVFGVLNERVELRPYNDLLAFVRDNPRIELTKLMSTHTRKYLYHEVQRALDSLVASDVVGKVQENGRIWIYLKEQPHEPKTAA